MIVFQASEPEVRPPHVVRAVQFSPWPFEQALVCLGPDVSFQITRDGLLEEASGLTLSRGQLLVELSDGRTVRCLSVGGLDLFLRSTGQEYC